MTQYDMGGVVTRPEYCAHGQIVNGPNAGKSCCVMRQQEKDMWMFGEEDFWVDRARAEKRGDVFCDELGDVDYLGRIKSIPTPQWHADKLTAKLNSSYDGFKVKTPNDVAMSAIAAPIANSLLVAAGAPGCVGGVCHWDGAHPLRKQEIDEPTLAILRAEGVIK